MLSNNAQDVFSWADDSVLEPQQSRPSKKSGAELLKQCFAFLTGHWETAALIALLLAFFVMLAAVLWPAPESTVDIRPFAIKPENALSTPSKQSSITEPTQTVLQAEMPEDLNSAPTKGKSRSGKHYHHTPKKPKHPPITSLNKASLSQLQLLPGIGPKMAQRIVAYRKEHGAFTDIAQVMDVKGIGPKKFEKMKAFLKI